MSGGFFADLDSATVLDAALERSLDLVGVVAPLLVAAL